MTVKHTIDRQVVKSGQATMGIAQMGAGNECTFTLRPKTHLLRMVVHTITAFDSVTTATATVGDGTTTFASGVDIKTTGSETVTNVPKYYPSGGTLTASLAQTGGDATVGEVVVHFEYVIRDNGDGGIEE